jgi:hypothetical protein
MLLDGIEAILRGQWSHAAAVLRGQLPYWFASMRQSTPQELALYGAFLVASFATVRTCRRSR